MPPHTGWEHLAEEAPANAGSASDEEAGVPHVAPRRRLPYRSLAAVAVSFVAAYGVVLCLPAATRGRPGPLAAGVPLADGAALESKAEAAPGEVPADGAALAMAPPPGFDFTTAVAIKWALHPEDCLEATGGKSHTPAGLQTTKCSEGSVQFILPKDLVGPISLAADSSYCLIAQDHGRLAFGNCSAVPAAKTAFSFMDGRIHLKADTTKCVLVDSHSTDKRGDHDVGLQDCNFWDGDSLFPPEKGDYKFAVDWPPSPTTTTTETATITEAPTTTEEPTTTEAPTTTVPPTLPPKVILKSVHDTYVGVELGGGVFANKNYADSWERFDVVDIGEGSVALKSSHGFFLTASFVGFLTATSKEIGDEAHFHVERADGGSTISLVTTYGKYVVAEPSGIVIANRPSRSDWAEFQVIDIAATWPSHVAIKAPNGRYVRAWDHGGVRADGIWPLDDWESFRVTNLAEGTITLLTDHGEYLASEENGWIHAYGRHSAHEEFKVTHLRDGNFTLQNFLGNYLWVAKNGTISARDVGAYDDDSKFQVVMVP
uniref:Fascin domain-containing protein n=1 Tax=Alexandrium monilatum TaxID=311494 RepID=A0A7S4R602_9DINO